MRKLLGALVFVLALALPGFSTITLINGHVQGPTSLVVPNGSMQLQLNIDSTIIAAPGGQVMAAIPVTCQFDANGDIVPTCTIWSNLELNPQNSSGLGTWYKVTFFDANGSKINLTAQTWQFTQAASSIVDISQMRSTSQSTIYYPLPGGGGGGISSLGLFGSANQITVTGCPSTIVSSAVCTFHLANPINVNTTGLAAGLSTPLNFSQIAGTIAQFQLPSSVVFKNQSNTYTTGVQDMTASAGFRVPVSAGAVAAVNGDFLFDSTELGYSNFAGGTASWFATFTAGLNPGNGNCPLWINDGVHAPTLGDTGSACGSGGGGSGTVTSVSTVTTATADLLTAVVSSPTVNPTITFAKVSGAQNLAYMTPNGSSGVPTLRAITSSDVSFSQPNALSPFCYASYYGSNANSGLTWGSPKADIMSCYDALPAKGGTIFITDGGTSGTPIPLAPSTEPTNTGIWIANTSGSPDPNYIAINPGLNITDVAAAVGSNTVYTASSVPATLTATQPKITFAGAGLNAANAGTFTCTANTLTTVTCTNASGVLQSGLTTVTGKLTGWRAAKQSVAFIGVGGALSSAFSQTPQVGLKCLGTDNTHPCIWLSDVFGHTFMNMAGGFPSRYLLLGIGSDNNILTGSNTQPASWNNKFINIGFRSNSALTGGTSYGPPVIIGSNSDWNSFDYDQISANSTEAPTLLGCSRNSSNLATCTISTSNWPAAWSGTMDLSVDGTPNTSFIGFHSGATIASTTTITFTSYGPSESIITCGVTPLPKCGKVSSDAGQAMLINPFGISAGGTGIFSIEHTTMNGGGIRYHGGGGGSQVNIYDVFSESGYAPPVDIIGCNQIAGEQQVKIDTVIVADNVVNPLPGARLSNFNTPCARGVFATNTTIAGPFTLGPGAVPVVSTILPPSIGSFGIVSTRSFAQEDTPRRAFGPAAFPDGIAPIALQSSSVWGTHLTGCGSPNVAGTAYASPDGLPTGAALVAPGSGGLQYACMVSKSVTFTQGDYVVIGSWTRSTNSNGYQNGTTIQASCVSCIWNGSGNHQVSAIPTIGGAGEWQWTSTWDKIATGTTDNLAIQGYTSSTNPVAFYGMTALYIPASLGYNDNEVSEIALRLMPLNQTALPGQIALLPLQTFKADLALVPNVNNFIYATFTDASYATDDTANIQSLFNGCAGAGCTIYLPPGQLKATALLTLPVVGYHLIGAGAAGGGPGSGGPQLGTTSIGCFTAHTGLLKLGTASTANYGGGSIENITFVDKTGSGTCGVAINAINQSYVEFNNLGFQGFSEAATAAPTLPVLSPSTSGGSLPAATYFVAITDVDALGRETLPSTATSTVVGGSGSGSISLATHTATSPMTAFNIYVGASATTLHLATQGHANGTSNITATAPSGVAPPNMDHSFGTGLNLWGSSGNFGSLSGGYANQNIIRNVQVYGSTRLGMAFDRNTSGTKVESGNINLASLTSGYGMIAGGTSEISIHTEAGGAGVIRAGLTGSTGRLYLKMDLGSGTQTGVQLINAWNWNNITVDCSANGNAQTPINADSTSNGNYLFAFDNLTCTNPLIVDNASFQAFKYDSEAKTSKYTNVVDGPLNTVVTTTATISLADGFSKTLSYNQDATAAAAITYTLPVAAKGLVKCVTNSDNAGTPDTGTLQVSTSGSGQFVHAGGGRSASGGYIISGGVAGDSACFAAVSTTDWIATINSGTWTLH